MQTERRLPVARPAIFHPMQLFQEENHHHGRIEVICGSMPLCRSCYNKLKENQ